MTRGADWTGAVGDVWAAEWRRTDRSFADLARHLDAAILAAAPASAFRALDIGCGAGGTSLALAAARADAAITGVDLSSGLIDVARSRAIQARDVLRRRPEPWVASDAPANAALRPAPEHDDHVCSMAFIVGDAIAAAATCGPFDLYYSRHGVMFFDDPVAAFAALRAAASPGAALVFSCFADWTDNAFASALAEVIGSPPPMSHAPGPFAFQNSDHVATVLAKAGWTTRSAQRVPFAYRAGEGEGDAATADALSFFQRIGPAATALRAAAPADRVRLVERITAVITDHRIGNAIDFPAVAWIWSATA